MQKSTAASGKYLNIGNEGFRSIRNSEYVDKTGLIRFMNKCLDTPQKLICVSRPRRFGKSFATKMLCAYYSKGCDSKELFEDLQIAKDPAFAKNLNQYEVLYLDITLFLSTLKQDDMLVERMEQEIINDLGKVYPEVGKEQHLVDALCAFHERTEEKMILIIDEWDAMFRECKGQTHILDAYILLLRSLFKSSLTDQLFSGVYMTGILPIKKYGHESAVSDFYEYTMVDPCPLQEYIGFTETEVEMLCKKYQKDYALMQQWYDGYFVGGIHVYNPKSVMESILRNKFSSYWTKTETYEALKKYIQMDMYNLKELVTKLIAGSSVAINPDKFQNDMTTFASADDVLTLLVHLGYLTYDFDTRTVHIPNQEVQKEFINCIEDGGWEPVMDAIRKSEELLSATISGDEDTVARIIEHVHQENTSILAYNDENSLACVISLAYYSAKKNYVIYRELVGGKGFADLVFIPRKTTQAPAIVVELKRNQTADAAIDQIKRKEYVQSLKDYRGEVLLVGINYESKDSDGENYKKHFCKIERMTIAPV